MGLLAPAGTPRDVIDRLAQAANEALKSEEVLTPLRAQGFGPIGSTPDEFGRYIAGELTKWAGVVNATGLTTK
jgi:tripartite-type tricarboxylate transporter receptor subunit TctC